MKYIKRFRVEPGSKVKLKNIDPGFKDHHANHKDAAEEIAQYQTKLRTARVALRRWTVLPPDLPTRNGYRGQGRDDQPHPGTMNPQGCSVAGFKEPSSEELSHDFLWRIHRAAPPREASLFQPLPLRGRADRPRPQLRPTRSGPADTTRSTHSRTNSWRGTRYPQVLPAHLQTRTTQSLPGAARRSRQAMEDQRVRLQGAKILGRLQAAYEVPCRGAARNTHPGSSSPPTTSGSGTSPWPASWSNIWRGSVEISRTQGGSRTHSPRIPDRERRLTMRTRASQYTSPRRPSRNAKATSLARADEHVGNPKNNRQNRVQAFVLAGTLALTSLVIGSFFSPVLLSLALGPFVYWWVRRRCLRRLRVVRQSFPASWERVLQATPLFSSVVRPRERSLPATCPDFPRRGPHHRHPHRDRRHGSSVGGGQRGDPHFRVSRLGIPSPGGSARLPGRLWRKVSNHRKGRREHLGMVGLKHLSGVMILSKPSLLGGFDNSSNQDHVGVHEFAHLVEKEEGRIRASARVPWQAVKHWVQYVARELSIPEAPFPDQRLRLHERTRILCRSGRVFLQVAGDLAAKGS